VTESIDHIHTLIMTTTADKSYMRDLVEQLHTAGKMPRTNQCYAYISLLIYEADKYDVENLNPVPASDHFAATKKLFEELGKAANE
jgi:ribosomal protein L17